MNHRQPNRLLLTDAKKLVNLKVQRTDWALGGDLGGSFFLLVASRAPFWVSIYVVWSVRAAP
jgi:hypothetical protein